MTLYEFVAQHYQKERTRIVLLSLTAGLCNAAAFGIVTQAVRTEDGATQSSFLAFTVFVVLRIGASRRAGHRTLELMEQAIHETKTRLVEKIAQADLLQLERLGTSQILEQITQKMTTLSTSAPIIIDILQSAFLFAFSLAYLSTISLPIFFGLIPFMVGLLFLYEKRTRGVERLFKRYSKARVDFLDKFGDLLAGAKEIKLNQARARDVRKDFDQSSAAVRDIAVEFTQRFDDNNQTISNHLYLLLGLVVFGVPTFIDPQAARLAEIVALLTMTWSSLLIGLKAYPIYVHANVALGEIADLENKLRTTIVERKNEEDPWGGKPGAIQFTGVEYVYPNPTGDTSFRVGPIDLRIESGEIVFIVGGNGAGKSTLLKLLTGLYGATKGTVHVGAPLLEPKNMTAYREMISVIFADFHLFSKVYGKLDVDPAVVRALLAQMQIDHVTDFANGKFTRQKLSTGQRKRLAMIIALLDDRPILVLDEWAADQDPEFRKYFYEEFLPMLKRNGKTVVAVSHDDRYFHCADHVVTMEYGQLRSIRPRQTVRLDEPSSP
jgi:putative ATP-binding cassette transporter